MNDEAEMWRRRLERQKDTSLTDREYAQELGVDTAALARWRKRLADGVVTVRRVTVKKPKAPVSPHPEQRCGNPRCGRMFIPTRLTKRYCSLQCQRLMCHARWHRKARAKGTAVMNEREA